MAAPKGISSRVSRILDLESSRLEKKAETEAGLDDADLARMQKLLQISQILVNPTKFADVEEGEIDQMVTELTPKRDATLFPKRGPKVTAKIHEPEAG